MSTLQEKLRDENRRKKAAKAAGNKAMGAQENQHSDYSGAGPLADEAALQDLKDAYFFDEKLNIGSSRPAHSQDGLSPFYYAVVWQVIKMLSNKYYNLLPCTNVYQLILGSDKEIRGTLTLELSKMTQAPLTLTADEVMRAKVFQQLPIKSKYFVVAAAADRDLNAILKIDVDSEAMKCGMSRTLWLSILVASSPWHAAKMSLLNYDGLIDQARMVKPIDPAIFPFITAYNGSIILDINGLAPKFKQLALGEIWQVFGVTRPTQMENESAQTFKYRVIAHAIVVMMRDPEGMDQLAANIKAHMDQDLALSEAARICVPVSETMRDVHYNRLSLVDENGGINIHCICPELRQALLANAGLYVASEDQTELLCYHPRLWSYACQLILLYLGDEMEKLLHSGQNVTVGKWHGEMMNFEKISEANDTLHSDYRVTWKPSTEVFPCMLYQADDHTENIGIALTGLSMESEAPTISTQQSVVDKLVQAMKIEVRLRNGWLDLTFADSAGMVELFERRCELTADEMRTQMIEMVKQQPILGAQLRPVDINAFTSTVGSHAIPHIRSHFRNDVDVKLKELATDIVESVHFKKSLSTCIDSEGALAVFNYLDRGARGAEPSPDYALPFHELPMDCKVLSWDPNKHAFPLQEMLSLNDLTKMLKENIVISREGLLYVVLFIYEHLDTGAVAEQVVTALETAAAKKHLKTKATSEVKAEGANKVWVAGLYVSGIAASLPVEEKLVQLQALSKMLRVEMIDAEASLKEDFWVDGGGQAALFAIVEKQVEVSELLDHTTGIKHYKGPDQYASGRRPIKLSGADLVTPHYWTKLVTRQEFMCLQEEHVGAVCRFLGGYDIVVTRARLDALNGITGLHVANRVIVPHQCMCRYVLPSRQPVPMLNFVVFVPTLRRSDMYNWTETCPHSIGPFRFEVYRSLLLAVNSPLWAARGDTDRWLTVPRYFLRLRNLQPDFGLDMILEAIKTEFSCTANHVVRSSKSLYVYLENLLVTPGGVPEIPLNLERVLAKLVGDTAETSLVPKLFYCLEDEKKRSDMIWSEYKHSQHTAPAAKAANSNPGRMSVVTTAVTVSPTRKKKQIATEINTNPQYTGTGLATSAGKLMATPGTSARSYSEACSTIPTTSNIYNGLNLAGSFVSARTTVDRQGITVSTINTTTASAALPAAANGYISEVSMASDDEDDMDVPVDDDTATTDARDVLNTSADSTGSAARQLLKDECGNPKQITGKKNNRKAHKNRGGSKAAASKDNPPSNV